MRSARYRGRYGRLVIDGVTLERGETVRVPERIASRLEERDDVEIEPREANAQPLPQGEFLPESAEED